MFLSLSALLVCLWQQSKQHLCLSAGLCLWERNFWVLSKSYLAPIIHQGCVQGNAQCECIYTRMILLIWLTQVLAAHSHVFVLKKLIWSRHVFNQVGEWMCAWSSLLLGRPSVSCTACVAGTPLQAAPFFTRWIYLILICFLQWGRKEEDIVQCFKLLEKNMPGSADGSARKWLWHPWQDQLPCSSQSSLSTTDWGL